MGKNEKLKISKDGLTLGGKPFYLASGDMHYFRIFKDGWKRRLQLMKDFGLTAVQTYVPWDLHEPEDGEFHFEGRLDIAAFLELCQEIGLKVMFRPSPYMCSEWDWGGLPYWLMNKDKMCIRTNSPAFMQCLRAYYERLAKEFIPYLSTNGGPIIAVAVENEYGSFGDSCEYIKAVGDLLIELGVDVPLYTANGWEPFKLLSGSRPEYWTMLDLHELTEPARKSIESYQPDKPIAVGEFWAGRSQQWGGHFKRQTPQEVAEKYAALIENNTFVNFYMFCGGTNFGFQNGALVGKYGADLPDAPNRYIPFATGYDVDALVDESGTPTQKYFECKRVLRKHLEKLGVPFTGTDNMEVPSRVSQSIGTISLTETADLLDNTENLTVRALDSGAPLTMEEMEQDYGFMLYTTHIRYTDSAERVLIFSELHDRALVFGNGEYLGCAMRDRVGDPITFKVPEQGLKLDILVENMGRVNYGNAMLAEHKGICGFVKLEVVEEDGSIYPYNYTFKTDWRNCSLPLKDLSGIDYTKAAKPNRPAFYSGRFNAKAGVDTFLNMSGWEKGVAWINGFNLGRYWNIGPQGTLYVPGELLKDENTITVLELHNPNADTSVRFDGAPSIDTIAPPKDELIVNVVG